MLCNPHQFDTTKALCAWSAVHSSVWRYNFQILSFFCELAFAQLWRWCKYIRHSSYRLISTPPYTQMGTKGAAQQKQTSLEHVFIYAIPRAHGNSAAPTLQTKHVKPQSTKSLELNVHWCVLIVCAQRDTNNHCLFGLLEFLSQNILIICILVIVGKKKTMVRCVFTFWEKPRCVWNLR